MLIINLNRKKSVLIDEIDAHLSNYSWYCCPLNYVRRNIIRPDGKRRIIFLHHVIMGYPLNGNKIDHINGNPLDNRRLNLRIVTQRENCQNRKEHRNKTKKYSQYLGVSWDKVNKKWIASYKLNGKTINLGRFYSAEEAAKAYKMSINSDNL